MSFELSICLIALKMSAERRHSCYCSFLALVRSERGGAQSTFHYLNLKSFENDSDLKPLFRLFIFCSSGERLILFLEVVA